MKTILSLLALSAASFIRPPRYGVLIVNDDPMPPMPPIQRIPETVRNQFDEERIEAAQAKRERKAARKAIKTASKPA